MLKAALIGFGGIAKSHRRAFSKLEKLGKAKLVCAYDINPEAFTKNVAINIDSSNLPLEESIRHYTDLDEMISNEEFDIVDICIPSYKHKEMTVKMLNLGYHVMCEKPMSLSYESCLEMIAAAKAAGRHLMIGQCLRFYASFNYLKGVIDDGRYGKVLGAHFSRLSTTPSWGWENWFMDPERSGGCITDLHIHDVDMIRYLFGEPRAVSCRASSSVCAYDTVHSGFIYDEISPVSAVADWTLIGVPFKSKCMICLEGATIVNTGSRVDVYPKDGSEKFVAVENNEGGHFGELDYFIDVIEGRIENTKNTPESAAATVKLVESLKLSADNGGVIVEI